MEKLHWITEKRTINQLKGFKGNPRRLTKKQKEDLIASISKFDLAEIPVIDQDNVVIAGNQRIDVLRAMGRLEDEIDVRVPSRPLTEDERKEYNLRSNKNTAEWDGLLLINNFKEDLLFDVGFTAKELEELTGVLFKNKNKGNDGEFELQDMELKQFEHYDYIVFVFRNIQDWINVSEKFNLKKVNVSQTLKQRKIGLGRVVEGSELLRAVGLQTANSEHGA